MNRVFLFIGGLLSGSLVGAAVGVLLAPHSGAQTRRIISNKTHEIITAGKQAAEEKRRELQREYEAAIQIPLVVERPNKP